MPRRLIKPTVIPASSEQIAVIDAWRGSHKAPDHMRLRVLPWTRACVLDAGQASVSETRRRLSATAALAVESLMEGLPLEREIIFDPANVEHIIGKWLVANAEKAATYRSTLRRMGPVVTQQAPWLTDVPHVSRRAYAPPYSDPEMRGLEQASRHQPTPSKDRVFRTVVALGRGAGLDGRIVPWVRADDVLWVDQKMCIQVSRGATRVVPVLKPYWATLQHLTDGLPGDAYLLSGTNVLHGHNHLSQALDHLDIPRGLPSVHCGRLRSTWLVYHLNINTRIPELLAAAGLHSTTWLSDLMPYVPPLPKKTTLEMLSRS